MEILATLYVQEIAKIVQALQLLAQHVEQDLNYQDQLV